MNKKLISDALDGIDDRFVAEAMVYHKKKQSSPERTSNMGRYENTKVRGHSRKLAALILAACLVFALAATAYAANAFGIRDMFRSENRELPEEMDPYIQQHTEKAEEEEIHCQIDESYCDSGKVMVTLTVLGGDDYILASDWDSPDSLVSEIGIDGDQTLGDYAREQGKKLLFVFATMRDTEELGIFEESYDFKHPSPGEMHCLVMGTRMGTGVIAEEAKCGVYIRDEEGNQKHIQVPFTLNQAEASDSGTFVPDNPNALPGITIGNATVTKEASGVKIRWKADAVDQMAFNFKTTVEEITEYNGGYVLEDDGYWYFELYMGQGEVNDTLTFHFTDWDSGESIADVVFTRQK